MVKKCRNCKHWGNYGRPYVSNCGVLTEQLNKEEQQADMSGKPIRGRWLIMVMTDRDYVCDCYESGARHCLCCNQTLPLENGE